MDEFITLELRLRIANMAKRYNNIEDLLLWVNDTAEIYEFSNERLLTMIKVAKQYFNKFHN